MGRLFELEQRRRPSAQGRLQCSSAAEHVRGLEADAAVISTYLKTVSGPVVLVGHSYGGSVISVASANAPNVTALVYVDAFAPEAGESIQEELASAPPRGDHPSMIAHPEVTVAAIDDAASTVAH